MIAAIFDTETTGLVVPSLAPVSKQPYIIEFFGCVVDTKSGDVLNELEFLCRPPAPISEKITKITGLTNDDLKDQPEFWYYAQDVRAFFEDVPVVVAHNLTFDMAVVRAEILRNTSGGPMNFPPRRICTVEATESFCGRRLKLAELHEHVTGEPFKDAHRARHDVQALTRCFVELDRAGWF